MPEISIIVPVYKVEKYLDRCIESILSQTFTDFELILIDDGSPDNCPLLCDEWAKKDNRIKVIHQTNQGVSVARNLGIEIALSEDYIKWVMFVDSDDWIHEDTLKSLLNANIENKTDISICAFEKTDGENPIVNSEMLSSNVVNTEDFYVNHIATAITVWGKLYKKNCFSTIRFPIGKLHEDSFTNYRILFKYDKISFINQPMYAYYTNPNGIMNSSWHPKRLDDLAAIKEQIVFFDKNNYFNAYKSSIHVLFVLIYTHYLNLRNTSYNKKYKKIVKREMKKAIHKYKKIEGISFKKYKYYYDVAYPILMQFYWIIVSKLKKEK